MGLRIHKYIPIHGIRLNKFHSLTIPIQFKSITVDDNITYIDDIELISYQEYLECGDSINKNDIKECDLIAKFSTLSHNTLEIENIKVLLSILFFSDRMANTNKLKSNFIKGEWRDYFNDSKEALDILEKKYNEEKNEFFINYNLPGYFDNNRRINDFYWYVSLGNSIVNKDSFDRSITRGFSTSLWEEYGRQKGFYRPTIDIDVTSEFKKYNHLILKKLYANDEYSKKIKSTLRLYYNVLFESDMEQAILTYSTILETLLLKSNETKAQKVKVSNRAACIIANNMNKSAKIFIANRIMYFYNYRNAIIHEGKSYLEIDNEVIVRNILFSIRHIIYLIIKHIIMNDSKKVKEIEEIVKNNLHRDSLRRKEGYVTYSKENNKSIPLFYE